MQWMTLRMQVTTPLFNGGVDPGDDGGVGVRVPSIRGALRFWFRALAGRAIGPDLRGLARVERQVFGGTDAASPVKLRIPSQPPVSKPGRPDFVQGESGRWVVYLLGQGLGDLKNRLVTRPYVAPTKTFDLQLRFTGDEGAAALAVASLWLLCAYGGVGARTRRGFGGLRIVGVEGPLPDPWDGASILSPDLDHYQRLYDLSPAGTILQATRHLPGICRAAGVTYDPKNAWPSRPTYPVLSARYTRAGVTDQRVFETWQQVLAYAGEQLRHFRACQPYPGAPYPPPKIKTPEWSKVVRGPGRHFGLGALGLPVGYKDKYVVNADFPREPSPQRRSSPLWLRPVGDGTSWRLLSLAFHNKFLPKGEPGSPDVPVVHVWRDKRRVKPVAVEDADVTARTTMWIDAMRQGRSFVDDPPDFGEA